VCTIASAGGSKDHGDVNAGVLLLVGVALGTLASCTGAGKSPSGVPSRTDGVTPSRFAVVGESMSLGSGESFDPPGANVRPLLTATQAWVAYARRAHARINRTHIPRGTTARLGVFIDGGRRRHLAYGYFTPNSAPVYTGLVEPSPPVLCTQWTMLTANTGVQIESSWFRCPPTQYSPIPGARAKR
jgi:hypothetical protein